MGTIEQLIQIDFNLETILGKNVSWNTKHEIIEYLHSQELIDDEDYTLLSRYIMDHYK